MICPLPGWLTDLSITSDASQGTRSRVTVQFATESVLAPEDEERPLEMAVFPTENDENMWGKMGNIMEVHI